MDIASVGIILSRQQTTRRQSDQTVRMCRLIWGFVVCIWQKQVFLQCGLYNNMDLGKSVFHSGAKIGSSSPYQNVVFFQLAE